MFTRSMVCGAMFAIARLMIPQLALAGVDEGTARYVPWSGTFWPIRQGALIRGPLAKYDRLTGRQSAFWELQQNPPDPSVPEWFGYCHAWAAAAVMDREPVQPRLPRGQDGMEIPLGIGDQKGMLTACHTDDVAQHYGIRFSGEPGEDPADIYPDQLWRVLKLYIQQAGVPLIVDIEGGSAVWNYPVYAYRVDYEPTGAMNEYSAVLSMWMADDAVPEDMVGVQVAKQTYFFTFELRDGAAQMGTGRWIEPSIYNHPDFAWYPYVVRAENPELQYDQVKHLVDQSGPGPSESSPIQPDPSAIPEPSIPLTSSAEQPLVPRIPGALPSSHIPPNRVPGASRPDQLGPDGTPRPGNSTLPFMSTAQPQLLSPVELLRLVVDRTSSFVLDVTIDKFDGGRYAAGESLQVSGICERNAYLYLFYLEPQGRLSVLYPGAGDINEVKANERFRLPKPERMGAFRTANGFGTHRIKAVATARPLLLTGLATAPGMPGGATGFRLSPGQEAMFKERLVAHLQGKRFPAKSLGSAPADAMIFAQDEVAFYVGPGDDELSRHRDP